MAVDITKGDLENHLGSPLNISQDKIATCIEKNTISNLRYCIHIRRENKIIFLLKKP